jgi:hypothetical protein
MNRKAPPCPERLWLRRTIEALGLPERSLKRKLALELQLQQMIQLWDESLVNLALEVVA